MPFIRWREEFYVEAYRLARDGQSDKQIAMALGADSATFRNWRKKRPALQKALDDGRQGRTSQADGFKEYVYQHLPADLKLVWKELKRAWDGGGNPVAKVEALFQDKGEKARQWLYVHALVSTGFNPAKAMKLVNLPRAKLKRWVEEDGEFADLLQQVDLYKGDFFEEAFLKLVKRGETAAVIHAAKTFCADRGYGVKSKLEVTGDVRHNVVTADDLDRVPLKTRLELLEALKKKEQPPLLAGVKEVPAEVVG